MKLLIAVDQILLWFVFRVYLLCSGSNYKTFLTNSEIDKDYGYVFAANHRHKLDPFMIGSAMPYRIYKQFRPFWIMAHGFFFKHWYFRWPLRAWGSFPAKPVKDLPYGIPFSTQVLANKGTVIIFPEGKRLQNGDTEEPKRGVSVLASLPRTQLIPVRIEWHKRKVSITVGKPIIAQELTPKEIMAIIYSL